MTFKGGWMDQSKPHEKHKLDYGRLGLHEIHSNKQLCPSNL